VWGAKRKGERGREREERKEEREGGRDKGRGGEGGEGRKKGITCTSYILCSYAGLSFTESNLKKCKGIFFFPIFSRPSNPTL
jgi:hypothetical protein